jgi:hypothetical protein
VGNIIIFHIQDALGMFNNGGSIGSQEVFDGLRQTIFAQEGSGLGAVQGRTRHVLTFNRSNYLQIMVVSLL